MRATSRLRGNRTFSYAANAANLNATLLAGGCGFDDIVDVTTFHTDPERQFETIMAVKSEVFERAPYPSWTALGVNWLAGFDFEIKAIARIPRDA
jgi:enamine deaminase RidA (YjgF/YER057c/UK114 family)